jgi:hypothetical protein
MANSTFNPIVEKTVLQWSISRSGSTLVNRILRNIFSEVHYFHPIDCIIQVFGCRVQGLGGFPTKEFPVICTIRNPIDTAASLVRISKKKQEEHMSICHESLDHHRNFWEFVDSIRDDGKDVVILKYESFWNNFDYIFKKLENRFNGTIDKENRDLMKRDFSISHHLDIQTKIGNDFNCIDDKSGVHGLHIQNPKPKTAQDIFDYRTIESLQKEFKEFTARWEEVE